MRRAGNRGELTTHEFFTLMYLLDLHSVMNRIPHPLPTATPFPPNVHMCYQASGIPVPVSLNPPTVAHVPLADQNPVENLNLQAEGATRLSLVRCACIAGGQGCIQLAKHCMWQQVSTTGHQNDREA